MLVSQGNATSKVRDVTLYELQMRGYRLTTAEIVYRLPDHPALLQTFIWQKFDLAPDFPELHKFLEFWKANIEGPLHSVNVKQSSRTAANRFRHFKHSLTLH
ncbi:MAG TPA: Usg family protein [Stellaceae bacterium]|nr:Usg family protein [Stellaceae bacterium]